MTITKTTTRRIPAILGGRPDFPAGLALVRPAFDDVSGLTGRIAKILESGELTNGALVRELEETVSDRCDVDHAVAVSSCTAGLMLTYQALAVTGSVVLPSFTFAASAHAISWAGGQPSFAEVLPDTCSLDPEDAATILDGASALSATHIYGAPSHIEELEALARAAGIPLIFDAAHALGSRHNDKPVGGFGTAEVFSLSPTKVATAGEGGLVTTNDTGLAEAVRLGREYGNPGNYDCRFPGLNARMSELHAALALASLERLDARVARRNELVQAFKNAVAGLPGLSFQHVRQADVSTYKDLTILVEGDTFGLSARELQRALRAEGVDTRRYYSPPIHLQQAYSSRPYQRRLPITERLGETALTLPLSSEASLETQVRLAETLCSLHHAADTVRRNLAELS